MNFRNLIYVLACLSFSVILGGAVYEHTALWPNAFSAIPKSLSVFQGAYKLNAAPFWMFIHPLTVILFVIALIANWKSERRKFIAAPLLGYAMVLIVTFTFFVPELIELTSTSYSDTIDAGLTARGQRWVTLSLVRGVFIFTCAVMLLLGLARGDKD